MKKTICLFATRSLLWASLAVLFPDLVSGQSLAPAVYGSAGLHGSASGISHSSTLGQVFYQTKVGISGVMTEGFHQPWTTYVCVGDFTDDGVINTSDLLILMAGYGCTVSCTTDMNDDGVSNVTDILLFMAYFSTICP
ncbi:MAG: hypothetical protein JNM00_04205 [Flavobacteriales bacterium]|nr:hypothetical protein [Flavobacteriales bacterium]